MIDHADGLLLLRAELYVAKHQAALLCCQAYDAGTARVACCGLLEVLSVKVSDAFSAAADLGENATASVHDLVGASVTGIEPQVPAGVTANSAESDDTALEMISGFFLPVL